MKILVIATIALIDLAVCQGQGISKEGLDNANTQSEYIARAAMVDMFSDTDKYIGALNDYIQKIECEKFRKIAKHEHQKFARKYIEFTNQSRELKKVFKDVMISNFDADAMRKFRDQIKKVDRAFTDASKVYTITYRKVNKALTKLDKSKIMYNDAEVFKEFSTISIRTLNYLVAIQRIIEIINARSDECGTLARKDEFFKDPMKKLGDLQTSTKKISDGYPASILNEDEYEKLQDDFKKAVTNYQDSVKIITGFEQNLKKKYQSAGIKFDRRFNKAIKMLVDIPFRISGFVTPTVLFSFIISTLVYLQF